MYGACMYMKREGCIIDGLVEIIFQMVGEWETSTYIDRGSAALERKSYLNLI